MASENIADKVDRLKRLSTTLGDHVCLELDVWVRPWSPTNVEVAAEWSVWDGKKHFKGTTVEEALHAAEVAHEIVKTEITTAVEMP